jgi:hypothetical protein
MTYTIVKKPVAEDGNLLYEIHDEQNKNMCVAYCVFSKHPSENWIDNNIVVSDIYVNHLYNKYDSEYKYKDWLFSIVLNDVYAEGYTHIIIPCNPENINKSVKYNIRNLLYQVKSEQKLF